MRVYIFNYYEEHGPENIRVAVSPEVARSIFEELMTAELQPDDWIEERKQRHRIYIATCRSRFERLMAADDDRGGDLSNVFWGGLQLHIVDVET